MKALDLRPDGTIVIRDGNRQWVLRRPLIGEWGTLVEMVERVDDDLRATLTDENGTARTDLRAVAREQARIIRGSAESPPRYAECVIAMITTLGSGDPPTISEIPVWCTSSDAVTSILGHWREVPLDLSPVDAG